MGRGGYVSLLARRRRWERRRRRVIAATVLCASFAAGEPGPRFRSVARIKSQRFTEVLMADTARAVIETKLGEIEIELLPDKAPGHVKNFLDLARKGFYDGTTFHRVIPGTRPSSTGSTAPSGASCGGWRSRTRS